MDSKGAETMLRWRKDKSILVFGVIRVGGVFIGEKPPKQIRFP